MRHFTRRELSTEVKADGSPVTVADRAIELRLRSLLVDARPADAFLGEEFGHVGDGPRRWIVDGIDGTLHFAAGRTSWGTLIALQDGEDIRLGIFSEPARGVRSWGERQAGAWS